jgi:hypothetical protein
MHPATIRGGSRLPSTAARASSSTTFYYAEDQDGLLGAAKAVRHLGFFGKSTLWPSQVAAINDEFA